MTASSKPLDTVIAELVAAAGSGAGLDPHHLAQELGAAGITSPRALRKVDEIMARLVDADQRGEPMDALKLASELGAVRALASEEADSGPATARIGHTRFRCETCGTMTYGDAAPPKCPRCGGGSFATPDLDQPNVESGAG